MVALEPGQDGFEIEVSATAGGLTTERGYTLYVGGGCGEACFTDPDPPPPVE